jgi:hypothetical protein
MDLTVLALALAKLRESLLGSPSAQDLPQALVQQSESRLSV